MIYSGKFAGNSEEPGYENAEEDGSFDFFGYHPCGEKNSADGENGCDTLGVELVIDKFLECYERGVVSFDDVGVLESDKGNKKADTDSGCLFERQGNSVENHR